jgi:predicted RNase H-like HicB family nuclease
MTTTKQLTAIIERDDDAFVALCPELDIASQGDTVEAARANLVEALELFFDAADVTEMARRLHGEVFITRIDVEVPVG